jgi:hypothetical protein
MEADAHGILRATEYLRGLQLAEIVPIDEPDELPIRPA